jgi:membrane protein YdbS with pleckstrin-like domain
MSDIDRYLLQTETAVVVVRRHWAYIMREVLIFAVCLLFSVVILVLLGGIELFQWLSLAVFLASSAWFSWIYADWWVERFVVTDKRVLLTSGLLTRRVAIMPLTKVTDMTYERSILGRILGYGVFVIESAGQDQALSRVEYLPNPDHVYQDVSMLLFGPKPGVVPAAAPAVVRLATLPSREAVVRRFDASEAQTVPLRPYVPEDEHTGPLPRP